MAELTGVPIPSIDWNAPSLPEVLRKFKRTCTFIFEGPLADKPERTKVQYLMLWVGETGRDIREAWNLSNDDITKLKPHWDGFERYARPKSNFRVARFQLRALKQGDGETVDAFMTKARLISAECEYANDEEQLLDTLIAGIFNDDI